ncbi:MAG: hypothetical protein JRF57_06580 [Deltaproteobacteria bacterium]|nr:hypothetical protein [Deltaproteobacteria bacterium]
MFYVGTHPSLLIPESPRLKPISLSFGKINPAPFGAVRPGTGSGSYGTGQFLQWYNKEG